MDDLPMYLSKLKLFNLVTAELLGTLSPYAPTPPFGFRLCFIILCEDFDDCPTTDFCHVHDFLEVDLFFRVSCSAERLDKPALSRIKV